ncbi:MAG: TerB family tellurite resistance protein [Candidatus Marinimicrobia bacterium]|nr:TerB family tellurite resistance protein [Candidatus Neomarinimicrobiota bacterium]
MFLAHLSVEQKRAFMVLAKRLMLADEDFAKEEKEILELMSIETGVPIPENIDGEETKILLELFPDKKSRVATMLEFIGIVYADSNVDPSEDQFISEVASAFQMTQSEIADYTSWITRQINLHKEAISFFDEGE